MGSGELVEESLAWISLHAILNQTYGKIVYLCRCGKGARATNSLNIVL